MDKGSLSNIGLGTGSKTGSGSDERQEKETQVVDFIGGGGGSRTPGPRLMSPLLYHLSYTAIIWSNRSCWPFQKTHGTKSIP